MQQPKPVKAKRDFDAVAADMTSGFVIALLNVTTAISMAALVFAGLPPEYYYLGVTILLLSIIICAFGGVLGSGFAPTILSPRSALAPIYSAIVASVIAGLPANDPNAAPTVIAAIMMATTVTGFILLAVSYGKIGNLIRYIPYPVMAGFFAGIGLIFVIGGLSVSSGSAVSLDNLGYLFSSAGMRLIIPAVLLGVVFSLVTRRVNHWAVFPLIILGTIALFYGATALLGISVDESIAGGWLPKPSEAGIKLPIMTFDDLHRVQWAVVFAQAGAYASLAVIATLILLVDASGIEMIAECELDYERELKTAGLTNIVAGLSGGYAGIQSAPETAIAVRLGGNSRRVGIFYALLVAIVMAIGSDIVAYVPTFVLGSLLFYVGFDFLLTWTWAKRHELPVPDFAIVMVIVAAIAFIGILEGIAFGIAIAVALFVISYSRLSFVKADMGGDTYDSIVVRNPVAQAHLNRECGKIWIMKLQGFLFFGTADRLFRLVQNRIKDEDAPRLGYLVLDFQQVDGLDATAVQVLVKLGKYARREGFVVILSGFREAARNKLNSAGFQTLTGNGDAVSGAVVGTSIEDAVMWCEDDILSGLEHPHRGSEETLESLLERMTGTAGSAELLAPYFEKKDIRAGEFLFQEGDDGTSLYVLASGTASVVVNAGSDGQRTIRRFEQGTILGEMALFTGDKRSASVHVEKDATFYCLHKAEFHRAQEEEPVATGRFQSYIVRKLSERLDRANKEIRTLG